ncbi:MAG: LacI family DNA-binding transcriptional regulator, partial [Alkalispirochaeta sp.]
MKQKQTATMKDVAREAGVSIGTVDRVLHNRGRFSPATADRVRAAAAALSFQPNLVASNLKRAQWRTLVAALPHPEQDGGFWQLVVDGINRAVQQLAHHYVRVRFTHYDRFDPYSFYQISDELARTACLSGTDEEERFAGIILAPTLQSASADLARRCDPMPVVVLDGELPDVDLLCSISQESYESGLLAAKLLHLMAGPGRYASVVVGQDDYHLLRRRNGFEDFFHGSVSTERIEAASETELREKIVTRARRQPGIDGIFVANAAAHTVIDALRDGAP